MGNDIFGGFTAVAQSISDKVTPIDNAKVDNLDDDDIVDPDGTAVLNDDEGADHIPLKDKDIDDDTIDNDDDDIVDDIVDDDDDLDGKGAGTDGADASLAIELEEAEPELAAYLQEKLFEKFGFDTEEAEEFKSIDDIVKFVGATIEENSSPKYADEELAKMDEFIRNGGNLEDYLSTTHGGVNVETVNLESPDNQKAVIQEHLKSKGYSDIKINRAIERYEDAGTLEEEAYDAKDMLVEFKEQEAEKLLENQRIQKELVQEEQQKYMEAVKNEIEAHSDVRGIPLTKKEKNDLFNYIFKPTRSGKTKYQEDYIKSKKNLIESAYFTMKGDSLVKKVQQKAASEAASRLRKKLASKGNRGRNQSGQDGSKVSDIWSTASRQLRNPF